MPKQPAIPGLRDAMKKKVTRREQFLAEMDAVVPWMRLQSLRDNPITLQLLSNLEQMAVPIAPDTPVTRIILLSIFSVSMSLCTIHNFYWRE